jgi:hypothetical protein
MADNHGDRMTGAWLSPLQVLCDTQIFLAGGEIGDNHRHGASRHLFKR